MKQKLYLNSFQKGNRYLFFIVESKKQEYDIIYDLANHKLRCSCFFSSNFGILEHNNRICKHKKFIKDIIHNFIKF